MIENNINLNTDSHRIQTRRHFSVEPAREKAGELFVHKSGNNNMYKIKFKSRKS